MGGTLFLDEIGEMPISSQVKMLRVLQEKEVTRVGESLPRPIDVRVIAASNRKLSDLVKAGKFREDLYYRLHVVALTVPPLRDHKEDMQDLISHFISQFNKEYDKHIEGCSPQAMERLINYSWPGNIRELEHVIEHAFAVTTSRQKIITLDSLPAALTEPNKPHPKTKSVRIKGTDEKAQLENALAEAKGNKSQAARILGLTRAGLYKRMRRLGL